MMHACEEPALESRKARSVPDQIRGGIMWFSILLLAVTLLFMVCLLVCA
jgi:hypothetical protein